MISANLELVRSVLASWEHGGFRSVEWADPEIEFVFADGPDPGTWRGHSGLADTFRDWLSAFAGFQVQADEYRELDEERVLVLTHAGGHGRASGLDLGQAEAKAANLFHVRDGRVTRLVVYFDREHALAELGLPSEGDSPRS